MKKIKTIAWAHCNNIFLQEAQRVWGSEIFPDQEPTDFVSFIDAMNNVSMDVLTFWIDNIFNQVNLQDFSPSTFADENACLFMTTNASEQSDVLNIISDRLQNFSIPADWCYADTEQRAIVHFKRRKDGCYYAELYCLGTAKSSYLHFTSEGYQKLLVPVNFIDESTLALYENQVKLAGSFALRDYLPKVKFDLLSRRRYKAPEKQKKIEKSTNVFDRGDML